MTENPLLKQKDVDHGCLNEIFKGNDLGDTLKGGEIRKDKKS